MFVLSVSIVSYVSFTELMLYLYCTYVPTLRTISYFLPGAHSQSFVSVVVYWCVSP